MRKRRIVKMLCIIMAMISLLGSTAMVASAAPQPRYGDPMYVAAKGGLNVRESPGTSSKIKGTLEYGTEVHIATFAGTKKDGYTWFLIDSPIRGYVALEYLSYTRPRSIIIDINEPSVG